MSRRFFVPPGALASDSVSIEGPLARRLAKVLRLAPGDEIICFDGGGEDARVRIETSDGRRVTGPVIERAPGPPESPVRINLYQSVTKGERFEWLLEKATEIGVARFVPLIAARAVVKTAGEGNRSERWRRIVVEAAEQCGRSAVPEVTAPQRFDAAIASAQGLLLLPYEEAGESAPGIADVLRQEIDALFAQGEISIFIGPEGGFEAAEVERARATSAHVITMGRRVLRSETAGLVASTLALHAVGELG